MNIGIVTTWFQRGAAYVSEAYQKVLRSEHNVYIYARGGEFHDIQDPKWNKKNVTRASKFFPKSWTWIDLNDFNMWLLKNNINFILFNEQKDWEAISWCKKNGFLTAAYIDYYTRDTIPFFELYDILFCNTKRHYEAFNWHPGVKYIPWGTDIELYQAKKRKEHNDTEHLVFFHSAGMGGINLRKGTDLLIKAFQLVEGKCKLVIHSQVELEKFVDIAHIIRDDTRIDFLHKTIEPPGLYHVGDVYVYPSRLEGIGLTILEALSSGLPVITTNAPPMNEFVENNVTGKLIEIEKSSYRSDRYYWPETICNIENLAKCMQDCVLYREDVLRMSKQARLYSVNKRNWLNNSFELNDIIENAIRLEISTDRLKYLTKASLLYTGKILKSENNTFSSKMSPKLILKNLIFFLKRLLIN